MTSASQFKVNWTGDTNIKSRSFTDFDFKEIIGRGVFGTVYEARDKINKRNVAIKKLATDNDENKILIPRELEALRKLRGHPNIISLVATVDRGKHLYLVFEHMNMDMRSYIRKTSWCGKLINLAIVRSYMCQLLKAIGFCHANGIIHRDLKPANILLNHDGQLKLADFGSAQKYVKNRAMTTEVVTLWYRPPEILLGFNSYDYTLDTWALGCIMYELLTSKVLFQGDSEIDQLCKICMYVHKPKEMVDELMKNRTWRMFERYLRLDPKKIDLGTRKQYMDLLLSFIRFMPEERIAISQALQSDLLKI